MTGTSRLLRQATAVASCGALLCIAWFTYGRSIEILPGPDDLYNFEWATRVSAASALRGEPAYYPEWRPLAAIAMWLQYQWAGLDRIPTYFIVNLLLWTACAWLVCRLVATLTDSALAGFFAGWIVLADARGVYTVSWIVERQMSMACLFGLLALSLVVRDGRDRRDRGETWTRIEWAGLWLLLLASALSKEFGLAFAVAIFVWHVGRVGQAGQAGQARQAGKSTSHWTNPALAALAAILVYAGLRLALTSGGTSRVCEEMGYFFSTRQVCFAPIDATAVSQVAYNIAAAGVDSILPGLFTGDGSIALSLSRLPASIAWLVLAAIGFAWGPRPVRLAALALAANVALNFMLYRDRNHLIGLCAMAIAAGVGLGTVERMLAKQLPLRIARCALLFMLGILVPQTVQTRRVMHSNVDETLQHDPCEARLDYPNIPVELVRQIKTKYGLSHPDCAADK